MFAGALLALSLRGDDRLVRQGFDHFYNLEYDRAIESFSRAVELTPQVPDLHNNLAEAIVFREMYRGGALESELVTGNNPFLRRPKLAPSPETEKRFLHEVAATMSLCQARLARNPKDTEALYAMGIAYGLRANWNFLVRKAWREALRDATEARRLHNSISALDPANIDARLTQGLHDYIVGSLPFMYRMLGFLVGFRGDKERGIQTVQLVAREGRRNRLDAEVFLCALYRREGQPQRALPLVEDLLRRFPRNYLLRFEQAQMYSSTGDKGRALAALQKVGDLKKQGVPGYAGVRWEQIWFHMGNVEFWYNDLVPALEHMRDVTRSGRELDLNTGVLAWMRQGQIHDLRGERHQAISAYNSAIAFAPQSDAARESKRYLASPYRRER